MADIPPQATSDIIDLPIAPGKKASDYVNAYKGITYSAIETIAGDVSSIQLKLYRRKMVRGKPEIEEVFDHEAMAVLHEVNSFSTFYDLIEATSVFNETNGECFWLLLRDGLKRPSEIWTLRPDWVTIIPDKKKVISGYRYKPGGYSDYIDFEPNDIIHFKSFNPKTMQRGMGGVQAAAMEIDLDDFAANFTRNFFFNSAMPSILFKFKGKIDEKMMKSFMQRWDSSFRGVNNAHKIAIIGGDVETEPLNANVDKMGLIEQRKYSRDQILAILQVPKSVLGIVEDVNRANADATIRAYMERTVKPKMKKLVAQLNEFYLPKFQGTEGMFFDFEDPVPMDRELQLKIYENGIKNGWLAINEVRAEENLPPVEGGDNIYLPFNLQPITNMAGAVGEKIMKLFGKGEQMIVLPITKKKMEKKMMMGIPPKRLKEIRTEALKKNLKLSITKLLSQVVQLGESEHKKDAVWRQMIAKTDVWEESMKNTIIKLFNEQESIIVANIENHKKANPPFSEVARFLFDLVNETTKWNNELEPQLKQIIKQQGKDTLDFLGLPDDMDMSQKRVTDFLTKVAGAMIKGINQTTLKLLRESLVEGVKEGEGIDSLKGRVQSVFESATSQRAETIARTEVLRATNFATNESYKQSGIVKGKEWLTALDERVCPICQPMDGKIVDVKSAFSTTEGSVEYPPAHPSCRCTTIPVII